MGWCPIISKLESKSKCILNECAWYDEMDDDCVTFVISKGIKKITDNENYDLHDISLKLDNVISSIENIDK
jgi:hypothetical protein